MTVERRIGNNPEQISRQRTYVSSFALENQRAFGIFESDKEIGTETAADFIESRLITIQQAISGLTYPYEVERLVKELFVATSSHFRNNQIEAGSSTSIGFIWQSDGKRSLVTAEFGKTGITIQRGSKKPELVRKPDNKILGPVEGSPTIKITELKKGDRIIVHPEVFRELDQKQVAEDLRTLKYPSNRLLLMSEAKLKEKGLPMGTDIIVIDIGEEVTFHRIQGVRETEPAPESAEPTPEEAAAEEPEAARVPPPEAGPISIVEERVRNGKSREAVSEGAKESQKRAEERERKRKEKERGKKGERQITFSRRNLFRALGVIAGASLLGTGAIVGTDRLRKDFLDGVVNYYYGVIFPYYYDRAGFSVDVVRDDLKFLFIEHRMEAEQYAMTSEQLLNSANLPGDLLDKLKRNGTMVAFADTSHTDRITPDYKNIVMAIKALTVLFKYNIGFFDKSGLYALRSRSGIEGYLGQNITGSLASLRNSLDPLQVKDGFAEAIRRSGGFENFSTARVVDLNDITNNSLQARNLDFEQVLKDKITLEGRAPRKPLGS